MAQRANLRWADIVCQRWAKGVANQNTLLAQRYHAIWVMVFEHILFLFNFAYTSWTVALFIDGWLPCHHSIPGTLTLSIIYNFLLLSNAKHIIHVNLQCVHCNWYCICHRFTADHGSSLTGYLSRHKMIKTEWVLMADVIMKVNDRGWIHGHGTIIWKYINIFPINTNIMYKVKWRMLN